MGVGAGLYMYMYVVVVQKFTFAISSPDEFLYTIPYGCCKGFSATRPTFSDENVTGKNSTADLLHLRIRLECYFACAAEF